MDAKQNFKNGGNSLKNNLILKPFFINYSLFTVLKGPDSTILGEKKQQANFSQKYLNIKAEAGRAYQ